MSIVRFTGQGRHRYPRLYHGNGSRQRITDSYDSTVNDLGVPSSQSCPLPQRLDDVLTPRNSVPRLQDRIVDVRQLAQIRARLHRFGDFDHDIVCQGRNVIPLPIRRRGRRREESITHPDLEVIEVHAVHENVLAKIAISVASTAAVAVVIVVVDVVVPIAVVREVSPIERSDVRSYVPGEYGNRPIRGRTQRIRTIVIVIAVCAALRYAYHRERRLPRRVRWGGGFRPTGRLIRPDGRSYHRAAHSFVGFIGEAIGGRTRFLRPAQHAQRPRYPIENGRPPSSGDVIFVRPRAKRPTFHGRCDFATSDGGMIPPPPPPRGYERRRTAGARRRRWGARSAVPAFSRARPRPS